ASGQLTEPKVNALIHLPDEVNLTGSYGIGATSLDAANITNGENAPFSIINAGEGGVLFHHRWTQLDLSARAVGFYTHVGEDLIFDPTLGRESSAPGTTRTGGV